MARVNVGVDPKVLSDQHLIAESVEITMITGSLRKENYTIKGNVPDTFCLGTGHINFFKPKIAYLTNRLSVVNQEMVERGFKVGTHIDPTEFPTKYQTNWKPTFQDSVQVRSRIAERLRQPKKASSTFHRYYGKVIEDMEMFINNIKKSKLNEF